MNVAYPSKTVCDFYMGLENTAIRKVSLYDCYSHKKICDDYGSIRHDDFDNMVVVGFRFNWRTGLLIAYVKEY